MSDPIDRQAALDALRTCYDTNLIVLDNGDELIHYGDAVGAIEALPSAQPGWIPVTVRLPQNGYWLWSANGGEVKKDFYWDGHWELAEKYGYEVLAWMPLPKPYREGGQDGED